MLRKYAMLIALLVLTLPAAVVGASADDGVFCGDLSAADCQILIDNAALMAEAHSLSFSAQMAMELGSDGIVGLFSMNGAVGGRLTFDPAAAAALEAAGPEAGAEGLATLMDAFVASIAGEISMSLEGAAAEDEIALELNVLLRDGVIYLDAGSMEALMGDSMGELQWLGLDTAGLIGPLLQDAGLDDATMDSVAALEDAETDVTTITRLPDQLVGGVPVAVFQSEMDLNAILAGITMEDLLAEARESQAQDVETAFAMAQGIDVSEFSSRQYIGLDDSYTRRMEVSMVMALDGEALGMAGADLQMAMTFDVTLSDFNEPVAVEPPQDAFVLPMAMMMQTTSQ